MASTRRVRDDIAQQKDFIRLHYSLNIYSDDGQSNEEASGVLFPYEVMASENKLFKTSRLVTHIITTQNHSKAFS